MPVRLYTALIISFIPPRPIAHPPALSRIPCLLTLRKLQRRRLCRRFNRRINTSTDDEIAQNFSRRGINARNGGRLSFLGISNLFLFRDNGKWQTLLTLSSHHGSYSRQESICLYKFMFFPHKNQCKQREFYLQIFAKHNDPMLFFLSCISRADYFELPEVSR